MNEELVILAKKIVEQLEKDQGFITSKIQWSSRYERLEKAYRGKQKNKIPQDRITLK